VDEKLQIDLRKPGTPNWPRVWAGLLILWMSFALLGTWFNYQQFFVRGHAISWMQAIRMNLVAYGIWALLLTPLVLFLCAKLPLTLKNWFKLIPAHALCIAAIVCVDVCIKTLLGGRVFPGAQSHPFFHQFYRYLWSEAEADMQIYLLIAVIGYVVAYYSELRSQERHAAELETNLIRAELQVLKMQLQPHFLFNTLHSVAALVNTDPRAAQKMICSLGDLLRKILASEDLPKVALSRELEIVELYLDIQRVRFKDRLVAKIHVDQEALGATVPYLLLQPLAENAIKYGVAGRTGMVRVEINIGRDREGLRISVANDYSTLDTLRELDGFGIGLENIRSRLRILYGSAAHLSAKERVGGRFQVEVWIPFEMETAPDFDVQANLPAARARLEVAQ
jgi:two-component system, LytTR family, sensor kinase